MRHCFTPEVVFDGLVDWSFHFCVGMCGTVRNSLVSSDEDSCQPVYENPPAKYNAEWIIKILLQPDETRVCYVKPSAVTQSTSYIVDVCNLQNQDDIKKDEFGIWNYSGSHLQAYKVYHEEDGHDSRKMLWRRIWSKHGTSSPPSLYVSLQSRFQATHLLFVG